MIDIKKSKGYINTDGLVFFFFIGLAALVVGVFSAPFIAYYQYQEHKENQQLIKDCERGLPREQTCEIIKTAKVRKGDK